MGKKLTRRESREAAFLTAFAATFEPEMPTLPAGTEQPEADAFARQLLAAMNDHADELNAQYHFEQLVAECFCAAVIEK